MGTAVKGFSLRKATTELRQKLGLEHAETIRTEGAPLPLQPHKRWDNGKDVLLAGDAAGVVAPSSGEGIFYAMTCGRLAADAIDELCRTGSAAALKSARRRFMRTHGAVFWILGVMQDYWYINDNRRERFVTICKDRDVQELTFDAYMDKELVKAKPLARCASSSRTWPISGDCQSLSPQTRRRWKPILIAVGAALVVAALGGAATEHRPLVPGAGEAVLAAARLAVRAGLDADLRAHGPCRARGLDQGTAGLAAYADHRRLRLQRALEPALEPALLRSPASRLGPGRGRRALGLDHPLDGRGPAVLEPGRRLLVPYLLWVSFAAFLNFTVVRLNAPFGG